MITVANESEEEKIRDKETSEGAAPVILLNIRGL